MSGASVVPAGRPDPARRELPAEGLTSAECAVRFGLASASVWRSMVRRGLAPPADDPGDLTVNAHRRSPRWLPASLEVWAASRPGRGNRTRR